MPDTDEAQAQEIARYLIDVVQQAYPETNGPLFRLVTEVISTALRKTAVEERVKTCRNVTWDVTCTQCRIGTAVNRNKYVAICLWNQRTALTSPAPNPVGEHIVRAAIQWQGGVWSVPRPGRHGDVFSTMGKLNQQFTTQGFLTSTGRFVNRFEAYDIARSVGQIIRKTGPSDELFSEDLW